MKLKEIDKQVRKVTSFYPSQILILFILRLFFKTGNRTQRSATYSTETMRG